MYASSERGRDFSCAYKRGHDTVGTMLLVLVSLVPKLDANLQRKLADDRRQKQIQERKDSRDARRAEYAKAGMSNTARIMATRGPD